MAMMDVSPVQVAVIGGTGDGGMPLAGGLAKTIGDQPNLVVTIISPMVAILVRFVNLYLVTLSGLLTAGGFGLLPLGDFVHAMHTASLASLVPASIGFIKDLVTVFGRLENKFPLLTGSV